MVDVSALLKQLPSLSTEDLDKVIAAAKAAKQFSVPLGDHPNQVGSTDVVERMLAVICDFCRESGVDARDPAMLKRSTHYSTFRQRAPNVVAFLRDKCGAHTPEEQRAVLWAVFVEKSRNEGVCNATILMSSIHRVPSVLNDMLPGYAAQGNMALAIKLMTTQGMHHAGS